VQVRGRWGVPVPDVGQQVQSAVRPLVAGRVVDVVVSALGDPPLSAAHRVDLSLDGQRRNLNTGSLQMTVPNVFRGTHTLQVVVIDAAGAEVMRSPTRNFSVQQNSIQNPSSPIVQQRRANGG